MVNLFAVPSVQYEVRLLLDKPCLKPLTLATRGPDRKRLGLNSFLTVSAGKASRPDIRSVLRLTTSGSHRTPIGKDVVSDDMKAGRWKIT
jgi:type VI secretion system protein ImpH